MVDDWVYIGLPHGLPIEENAAQHVSLQKPRIETNWAIGSRPRNAGLVIHRIAVATSISIRFRVILLNCGEIEDLLGPGAPSSDRGTALEPTVRHNFPQIP
jgi:hypothetical protein